MKNFFEKHMEILMVVSVALIYMGIKAFLGLVMSDNLSWTGLSLLLTYVVYDVLKIKAGIKN